MILVDTSVWIDHLRTTEPALSRLLDDGQVAVHPWVTGEIALGSLSQRGVVLQLLQDLPQVLAAHDSEVRTFIETRRLFGIGIGYVDAHLLASALLTPETLLWTRDNRLAAAADRLGLTPHPSLTQ